MTLNRFSELASLSDGSTRTTYFTTTTDYVKGSGEIMLVYFATLDLAKVGLAFLDVYGYDIFGLSARTIGPR